MGISRDWGNPIIYWSDITDDIDAIYAFTTPSNVLWHLRLTCIAFTVGQPILFSVKLYYIYGGVWYHI